MKIHRFILRFDVKSPEIIITDYEIIHQIKDVLRLEIGDSIAITDGKGNEVRAKIEAMEKISIKLRAIRPVENKMDKEIETILYCSLLKNKNFELVAQKATEVGIKTIVPIITKRTVKHGFNYFRLQKIIKEATEQCGRATIPLLCHPMDFGEAINDAKGNSLNIFFHMGGEKFDPAELKEKSLKRIGIFIGPEGGWLDTELDLAKEKNCKIRSLGNSTLRAETAAIVASYIIYTSLNPHTD